MRNCSPWMPSWELPRRAKLRICDSFLLQNWDSPALVFCNLPLFAAANSFPPFFWAHHISMDIFLVIMVIMANFFGGSVLLEPLACETHDRAMRSRTSKRRSRCADCWCKKGTQVLILQNLKDGCFTQQFSGSCMFLGLGYFTQSFFFAPSFDLNCLDKTECSELSQ